MVIEAYNQPNLKIETGSSAWASLGLDLDPGKNALAISQPKSKTSSADIGHVVREQIANPPNDRLPWVKPSTRDDPPSP